MHTNGIMNKLFEYCHDVADCFNTETEFNLPVHLL